MKELKLTTKSKLMYELPSTSIITEPSIAKVLSFGPKGFGDTSTGFRSKLWGAYTDSSGRSFTAIRNDDGTWGEWTERFALVDPVTDISLAFDFQGRPMIAYVRENRTFGVWYIPDGSSIPTLVEVGSLPDQKINRIAFGLNVDSPEFATIGETVLSYIVTDTLYCRFASEAFATEHTINLTTNYDRTWLVNAGWANSMRYLAISRG